MMQERLEIQSKNVTGMIQFEALYFLVRIRISILGCLHARLKNLKSIISFLLGLLLFVSPHMLGAQELEWPWQPTGSNFQVTNNAGDNVLPSIAAASDSKWMFFYLAVWSKKTDSGLDIYGARITADGKIEGPESGLPISWATNDQMAPAVSWNGEIFFVVWQDKRSGKRWDIYGTRVTLDGHVLDPDGIPIAIGKSAYDQIVPAVAFDGQNFIVAWQGRRSAKTWNIYFTRVSRDGVVLDDRPTQLSPSLKDQASPAVAFDGTNYFVVWQDYRSGKFWDIYGGRVTPDGGVLDEKTIQVAESTYYDKWKPAVSWNGKYYLVVWMASPESAKWYLYGKRVSSQGQLLEVADLRIQRDTSNKAFPAILWDGEEHFLAWEEEPEGDTRILGMSINAENSSAILGQSQQVSDEGSLDASYPSAANNGTDILMMWQAQDQAGYWQLFGQCLTKKIAR